MIVLIPVKYPEAWWRHQMKTFSVLLALCAGNSPVTGEFPAQRPVTRSFDIFCDLRLNKRLSKQSWGWWPETPSRPLWRHCNGIREMDHLATPVTDNTTTTKQSNPEQCAFLVQHYVDFNVLYCSHAICFMHNDMTWITLLASLTHSERNPPGSSGSTSQRVSSSEAWCILCC